MPIDYAAFVKGQKVSSQTYLLDLETVSQYIDAVGSSPQRWALSGETKSRLVPPMAIAALSLRGVVNDLAIPGGTLHTGQELEFISPVYIGETLECSAVILQNSVRGDWRFLVVDISVMYVKGRNVMTGKSTIMLPV